jgi:hypothetical protein
MKLNYLAVLVMFLIGSCEMAHAVGKIQNEDVKSLSDIQSSVLTTTGNLTVGSACIASPGSTAHLAIAQFIYDSTVSSRIPSGTVIAGLPGSCSAGQIQMSNNATASSTGDTLTFGGQMSQLTHSSKIYDELNAQQLSTSIASGALAGSGAFQSYALNNVGIQSSVSASALTVALKQRDGTSDPSSGSPVTIGFRNPTATTGGFAVSTFTSALSLTIPSVTTIGTVSAQQAYIYVYAMYNGGSPVLAVSLRGDFDNGSLQSSSAISGGASATTLYSASAVSSSPVRLLGRLSVTEATAGTWASNADESSLVPFKQPQYVTLLARVDGRSGGSLVSQSESWISSVSTVSTGQTTLTFVPGAFTVAPYCVCTIHVIQRMCSIGNSSGVDNTSPSTSSMRIQSYTTSGAEDNIMDLACFGVR